MANFFRKAGVAGDDEDERNLFITFTNCLDLNLKKTLHQKITSYEEKMTATEMNLFLDYLQEICTSPKRQYGIICVKAEGVAR